MGRLWAGTGKAFRLPILISPLQTIIVTRDYNSFGGYCLPFIEVMRDSHDQWRVHPYGSITWSIIVSSIMCLWSLTTWGRVVYYYSMLKWRRVCVGGDKGDKLFLNYRVEILLENYANVVPTICNPCCTQ